MRNRDRVQLALVRDLLSYDPTSGEFRWKVDRLAKARLNARAGSVAGSVNVHGYVVIRIGRVDFYAHRLAFWLMTGSIPEKVDHISGERADNRYANLRPATDRMNAQNQRRPHREKRSGLPLGVEGVGDRYRSQIGTRGKKLHLGTFDTPEAAQCAYIEAKRCIHEGSTL